MSRRKGRTNIKLGYLNEINYIDRRLKKKNNEEETSRLLKKRELLTNKLKTKR